MSEAGASPSTGVTRLHQYCMTPSDFQNVRPLIETFGLLSRRPGSPLSPINPSPACCRHYPGGPDGCTHRSPSPSVGAFPELGAGRRPRLTFSRPARRLHVTACRTARPPTAAFVTRHRPGSYPPTAARQLPSPIDIGSCGLLLPQGLCSFQDTRRVGERRGDLGPVAIVPFPLSAHRTGLGGFHHTALQPTSCEGMRRVSTLPQPTELEDPAVAKDVLGRELQ